MFQSEKLSVPVDFTEESEKSLKYVLAFAKEISAQFVVLQVVEKNLEKYSLIFSLALLEKWPLVGRSIPTIPIDSLQREESVDLAAIIRRIVRLKIQSWSRNHSNSDSPVKILAVTFREDKIDMVIFELGKRLPFPHRIAVELLMLAKKLPYPVLLTKLQAKKSSESAESIHSPKANAGKNPLPTPPRAELTPAERYMSKHHA